MGEYMIEFGPMAPSQISAWQQPCELPAYHKYVLNDRRWTGSPAMASGTVGHKVLETAVIAMIDGEPRPSAEACAEVTAKLIDEVETEKIGLTADEEIHTWREHTKRIADGVVRHVLPTVHDPKISEQEMRGTLEWNDCAYELYGFIDLIDVDPETNTLRVRDLKTGSKWSPDFYVKSFQFPVYTALAAASGLVTDHVRIDHVRALTRETKHEVLNMKCGPQSHQHLGKILEQIRIRRESGIVRVDPTSWQCTERCPYWSDCEYKFPNTMMEG